MGDMWLLQLQSVVRRVQFLRQRTPGCEVFMAKIDLAEAYRLFFAGGERQVAIVPPVPRCVSDAHGNHVWLPVSRVLDGSMDQCYR